MLWMQETQTLQGRLPSFQESSKKMKKKTMMDTWSDNEDSSSEEELQKVAHLYFIAIKEEVSYENILDFTLDELQDTFAKLMFDFKKVNLKNKDFLKKKSWIDSWEGKDHKRKRAFISWESKFQRWFGKD